MKNSELKLRIKDLLFECRVLNINVVFAKTLPDGHDDPYKVIIGPYLEDEDIYKCLKSQIITVLKHMEQKEKKNNVSEYEKHWDALLRTFDFDVFSSDWEIEFKQIKNKYLNEINNDE